MSDIPFSSGNGALSSTRSTTAEEVSQAIQGLEISPNGRTDNKNKKKRSVRAYHSDLSAAATPDINRNSELQFTAPNFQGQTEYSGKQVPSSAFRPYPPPGESVSEKYGQHEGISLSSCRYSHQKEYMTSVSQDDPTYKSFFTFQNIVPPVAGTQFHTIDQGTASSKFMRASMYNVPETEQLRSATKLPVSVTVRPFAPLLSTEDPVPVVDMRQLGNVPGADVLEIGPPRCRRCRTYMNPAMQHTSNNKFVCNICQFPKNTVPEDYMSMINPLTGTRTDASVRPELHKGVYDLIVPKAYNFGGPDTTNNVLHHVFLIDVSERSIKQNLPVLMSEVIRSIFYSKSGSFNDDSENFQQAEGKDYKSKIAIITFDKRLNFYNLLPSLEATQMTVSSDLDDPFVPFHEGLFADPEESRIVIEDALYNLELLASENNPITEPEPCFAAACRVAMMCLQPYGGGKITSVLSNLPSWGPGRLTFKDSSAFGRTFSSEQEKKLLTPDNAYFHLLARDFVANNVGLDCFVVSPSSVDLSNIGWLCSSTGGIVHKWPNFNIERDSRSFTSIVAASVKKIRGYQAQLKLRCSNGLQVTLYYGTSSSVQEKGMISTVVPDPVIPVVSEDQTLTVLFQYDGKLDTKFDCHFQAAMLYTDTLGIRKVRVINLVLAVSESLDNIFNFVEQDAVVTTIVRDTLSFIGKQPLSELRESINEKLADVFTQYRAMCELGSNGHHLSNELLFPDSLKNLPIYTLALIKSRALRASSSITVDARLVDAYQMLSMPVERLVYHLCPAVVELHTLEPDDCTYPDYESGNHDGFMKLPKFKDLSYKELEFGIYIACNGNNIFVWIHPDANILLLKDVFGEQVNSLEDINPLWDELPVLDTHISLQVRNLVGFFLTEIIGNMPGDSGSIQIIRQGLDGGESLFKECLIEDYMGTSFNITKGLTYSNYLTNLHKAIRVKLENDKSSNKVKHSISSTDHSSDTLAQRLIHF